MMENNFDLEVILAPIPGDNPAGEDLRYVVYDDIKEAKREDDMFDRGDWETGDVKTAEWDKVVKLCVAALTDKTKDLQIAAWLTEALVKVDGFDGMINGLKMITGLLKDFWDALYPLIEDGDMDPRIGPLEFLNDKISQSIKHVPITSSQDTSSGYSWIKWQESRSVGYERDTRNQHGDFDEKKRNARDELIADGKLTAEDFDSTVELSTGAYYVSLEEKLASCRMLFDDFDKMVDEKFGANAPRLAELRTALDDFDSFMGSEKIKDMILQEKPSLPEYESEEGQGDESGDGSGDKSGAGPEADDDTGLQVIESQEKTMWEAALKKLRGGGIKAALGQLYGASCSMSSTRERYRYRLLMAKLCLKAQRPDLARPIVEELYALLEELKLERWESPMWIAEVHDVLYQCLTAGAPSDEDRDRAAELFKKICTIDVTKAIM